MGPAVSTRATVDGDSVRDTVIDVHAPPRAKKYTLACGWRHKRPSQESQAQHHSTNLFEYVFHRNISQTSNISRASNQCPQSVLTSSVLRSPVRFEWVSN